VFIGCGGTTPSFISVAVPSESFVASDSLKLGGIPATNYATKGYVDAVDRYDSLPNGWTNLLWSPSAAHTVTQLTAFAWVPGACTVTVGKSTYWSNAVTGWAVASNIVMTSTGSVVNCSIDVPAGGGLWATYGPGFASTSNGTVQIRMVPQ
jgi:hypothetical protein